MRRINKKYQARVWPGSRDRLYGSINLGLYETEAAAQAAIREWVKAGCHPARGLPPGILPKWVTRGPGGLRWSERRIREWEENGRKYWTRLRFLGLKLDAGPFRTAEEAFEAADVAAKAVLKPYGKLPPGVVPRAAGFAVRYWNGERPVVLNGPFRTPAEAMAAVAGTTGLAKRFE
jgi:hypothetical protein